MDILDKLYCYLDGKQDESITKSMYREIIDEIHRLRTDLEIEKDRHNTEYEYASMDAYKEGWNDALERCSEIAEEFDPHCAGVISELSMVTG